MKYSLENNKIFFNHIMFSSEELSKRIAATPEWTDNEELNACILVNGVEIPAEIVQDFFEKLYSKMIDDCDSKISSHKKDLESRYSDLDKEADRRVRKIIRNKAKKTLSSLYKAERMVKAVIRSNS